MSPPCPHAVTLIRLCGMAAHYGHGCPRRLGDTPLVPSPHPGGLWLLRDAAGDTRPPSLGATAESWCREEDEDCSSIN